MSNRTAQFLSVKVRVHTEGRRIRVCPPPMALYVVRGALMSCEGILGLIPGNAGIKARKVNDLLLILLMELEIEVKVSVGDKVDVRVKTS